MSASEPLPAAPAASVAVPSPAYVRAGGLAALRRRDFRILWLGMLLSSSTIMFQWFAIGRLIEDYFPRILGDSFPILLMLGIAGLTRGLGMLIASITGGAFADRHDRRNLAIGTQVVGIALAGLFALLIALDWIRLWQLFILLFAVAAAQTFDLPARQALIPQLVDRAEITNAVSLFTAGMQTSFAFSPLLAGYLLDSLGIAGTYAASMIGHGALLLALLFIHPRGPAGGGDEHVLKRVAEGMRYSRGSHVVFGILSISFTISALSMAVIINLSPYWVLRVLEVSPTTWGLLAAVWGIGAVSTSYFLSTRGDFRHKGTLFVGSALMFSLLFVVWSLVRAPFWFGLTQFFMAMCMSSNFVSGGAIIQNAVPDEVRGRVLSLFGLNQAIALTAGILVGSIAQVGGAETMVPLLAVVQLCGIGFAVLALPRLREVH